jgi:hypothetical protein
VRRSSRVLARHWFEPCKRSATGRALVVRQLVRQGAGSPRRRSGLTGVPDRSREGPRPTGRQCLRRRRRGWPPRAVEFLAIAHTMNLRHINLSLSWSEQRKASFNALALLLTTARHVTRNRAAIAWRQGLYGDQLGGGNPGQGQPLNMARRTSWGACRGVDGHARSAGSGGSSAELQRDRSGFPFNGRYVGGVATDVGMDLGGEVGDRRGQGGVRFDEFFQAGCVGQRMQRDLAADRIGAFR